MHSLIRGVRGSFGSDHGFGLHPRDELASCRHTSPGSQRRTSLKNVRLMADHPKVRSVRCGIATRESLSPLQRHHLHTEVCMSVYRSTQTPTWELAQKRREPAALDRSQVRDGLHIRWLPALFHTGAAHGIQRAFGVRLGPELTTFPRECAYKSMQRRG